MDFFELQAFIALANTLHFSKAASAIHLSPSALSRMIMRLETELQVTLIERSSRQLRLTDEGLLFFDFACDVIHKKEDMQLKIITDKNKLKGILRVYASVTACYSLLPAFAEKLSICHPELRLSVQTGDPSNAATAIREGKAELALDAKPDTSFFDFDFFPIQQSSLVFVTSCKDVLNDKDTEHNTQYAQIENLHDLITHKQLILPKAGIARERINKWLRTHNLHPTIAAETEGNEAILALTRLGIGVGLVPEIVLQNSPFANGLEIINIGNELGIYEIGFIQKPRNTGSLSAQYFRTEIGKLISATYNTRPIHAKKGLQSS